ncbi:acyl-CoA thioesterase [Motilimonas pumila]|uniref:Acyl-CoA thioesterase n=1 Tax=Motilimonas pumila TaxID=2303987 RepID=A0A418YE98_9GAMM|nr:hotdog domain-containing protein [Motilimonas pumila]RJG47437.1 acyl-CoA thioesterase [Motilimonas pumila]
MDNYQLVLTEHLNHYGYLFGGTLLKWVDETAYIQARLEHPGKRFVTVGMEKVSYKQSVELGSILKFEVNRQARGNTSVTYEVSVKLASHPEKLTIFTTQVTFVCVDKNGDKSAITD